MKIYVHHALTPALSYKLAHNLRDRVITSQTIQGWYRDTHWEWIFDPSFSLIEAEDGWHLLDWSASRAEGALTPFLPGGVDPSLMTVGWTVAFLRYCVSVAGSRAGWIFTLFRGEKLLARGEARPNVSLYEVESLLLSLRAHHIVTDTYVLDPALARSYAHLHYALTPTLFQWNEDWAIRWYVELGELRQRLSWDWDLIYSVRHHKPWRVQQLLELQRLGLDRVLVQRSDSLPNALYWEADPLLGEIEVNSIRQGPDFDHLDWIKNHQGYLDAFFRVILRGRMLLLDESWSGREPFLSQYLSEKTLGAVLARVPFLPTHTYGVEILSRVLGLPPHPYAASARVYQGDPRALSQFIQEFMGDFSEGCSRCQTWVDAAQTALLRRVREENSLLELCLNSWGGPVPPRTLL